MVVVGLVAIVCLSALPKLWAATFSAPTSLSLELFLEAPDSSGAFEVYVNQDFSHPLRVELAAPVARRYSFAGLPDRLTFLRLNPLDTAGVVFRLRDMEIVARGGGAGPSGTVIHRFDLSRMNSWVISGAEWLPDHNGFVSTNNDPTVIVPVDLDLAALIPPPTLSRAGAALAMAATLATLAATLMVGGWVLPDLLTAIRGRPGRAVTYLMTMAAIAAVAWGGSMVLEGRTKPIYEVQFATTINKPFAVAHLYVNANWATPWSADVTRPGDPIRFGNIPSAPRQMRLDLPAAKDAAIQMGPARFFVLFDGAPPRELAMLPTEVVAAWSLSGMHSEDGVSSFRADTRMPIMSGGLGVDLATLLPPTEPLPWMWYLARALGVVAGSLGVLLLPYAVITYARRAPSAAAGGGLVTLALLGWIATLLSSFPGHWVFDQFYVLNEFLDGSVSDLQPPFFAWIWFKTISATAAMGASRLLQLSTLLVLQSTVFWTVAALLALSFRHRWLGAILLALMAGLPSILSYLGEIGKDGQATTALLEATALIFLAGRHRSVPLLLLAALPLWQSFAVRSNGPIAVLPLCFYWSLVLGTIVPAFGPVRGVLPTGFMPRLRWAGMSVGLFALLLVGTVIFQSSVVVRKCCLGTPGALTLVHDLMGVSVKVGENLVPPMLFQKPDYSLDDIRTNYFPVDNINFNGLRGVFSPEEQRQVFHVWRREITAHPLAYLAHRWEVLRYFTGLSQEPNRYAMFTGQSTGEYPWVIPATRELLAGMKDVPLSVIEVRNSFISFWNRMRDTVVFRSYAYVLVGGLAVKLLWRRDGGAFGVLATYAGLSAALYYFSHFPLTSSASFRYISWSVLVVPLMTLAMAEDALEADPTTGRRRLLRFVVGATALVTLTEAIRLGIT